MEENDKFQVDISTIYQKKRKFGISGMLRVCNGERFLEKVINSHLPYLDEIVATYHQCTDSTEEILMKYHKLYPDKFHVYCYNPYVATRGSKEHQKIPGNSIHSNVNYYNYNLSKTSYQMVTKVDDYHITIDRVFQEVTEKIRRFKKLDTVWLFSGINLFKNRENKLGILSTNPFCGNGDHFFLPVNKDTYFQKNKNSETIDYQKIAPYIRYSGILFYHLRYIYKNQNDYTKLLPYWQEIEEFFSYYMENIPPIRGSWRKKMSFNIKCLFASSITKKFFPQKEYKDINIARWLNLHKDIPFILPSLYNEL